MKRLSFLLVALVLSAPAQAQTFSDYYNTVINELLDLGNTACSYTGGYSGWGWTCDLYESAKTIKRFVDRFEGNSKIFLKRSLSSALKGLMEGVGENSPLFQSINRYADTVYGDINQILGRYPDNLSEEAEKFLYDVFYTGAAKVVSPSSSVEYAPLSYGWLRDQVRTKGALSPVMSIFEQTSIASAGEKIVEANLQVQNSEGALQAATELVNKSAVHALQIASDGGPLADDADSGTSTSTASPSSVSAKPMALDAGRGEVTDVIPVEPLSVKYKRLIDSAVSSRDILYYQGNMLADLLSGQAVQTSEIVTAITQSVQSNLSTNYLLKQQVEQATREALERDRAFKAQVEEMAVKKAVEGLDKVTQLAIAAKSLGSLVDPAAVDVAVSELNSCLAPGSDIYDCDLSSP